MIILLIGPPGAGKGTQADLLVTEFPVLKISTGDALRAQIAGETELGRLAEGFMSEGKLVPDEILNGIIEAALADKRSETVLLDGYPRTIDQAKALDEFGVVDAVVHIDVELEALVQRLSGRRTCRDCGASFHVELAKPKATGICDKCGGLLVQRPDDTEEKVRVRLEVYEASTKPVLDYYRERDCYMRIDGMGEPLAVYAELKRVLGPMLGR